MSSNSDTRLSVQERFEDIYAQNIWGSGSGEGSLPTHTKGYARFLQHFIRDNRITSVVDLGCGDWQFSRFIDWSGVRYHGFDIARPVIEQNRRLYARVGVNFDVSPEQFDQLPDADLRIVKDVLQHWSNAAIERFLPTLKRYPFALLTNCAPRVVGGFGRIRQRRTPISRMAISGILICALRHFSCRLKQFMPSRRMRIGIGAIQLNQRLDVRLSC
jgi:SAM-dependent methyltransferase